MKLLIAIPTLTRADLLVRNREFLENVQAPDEVLILDNGDQSIDIRVPIEHSPTNLGVGGSWNLFMQRAFVRRNFDGLVILQDDIIWSTDRVEAARRLLLRKWDVSLFLAFHQFSVQVHRPSNLDRVGLYDPRFYPAYCEDDDYAIRMTRARQVYERFHELDPLPGSQIEGTKKPLNGSFQFQKLIAKWGDETKRINVEGAPYYATNRSFCRRPLSAPHPVFEGMYTENGPRSGPGSSPEHTTGWRTFLEEFILKNKVKSVLDFGCGDWQFSRLIDWRGASYHGVDVVPLLIENLSEAHSRRGVSFSCVDSDDPELPDADLLVTKDVLQHLSNGSVAKLLEKFRKYRYVLLVNDWTADCPNVDTGTSGYRPLDFSRPPFSLDVSLVFDFQDRWGKRAYLWTPSNST